MSLLEVYGVKGTTTRIELGDIKDFVSRLYHRVSAAEQKWKQAGQGVWKLHLPLRMCKTDSFSCKASGRVKCERKEGDGRRSGGFMKGAVFIESTAEELNHSFALRYRKRW